MALSLRTLARLEVAAVACAFLVPGATMAKRLVRARAKIATARIPYAIRADTELPGRLAAVLAVVYLVATEAHAPPGGDAVSRVDLEAEAIRLARLLAGLMPDEPEALSLLALFLLTSARTSARTDAEGNPVTLADQDRACWSRNAIAEGSAWRGPRLWPGPPESPGHIRSRLTSPQPIRLPTVGGTPTGTGSSASSTYSGRSRPTRWWRSAGRSRVTERDGPDAGLAALKTIVGREYSHLWHAALADNFAPVWPHERGVRRTSRRGNPGAQRSRTTPSAGPSALHAVRAFIGTWPSRSAAVAGPLPRRNCSRSVGSVTAGRGSRAPAG